MVCLAKRRMQHLDHCILHEVFKFQICECDNYIVIGEKPARKGLTINMQN